jgi:hypothetical protein
MAIESVSLEWGGDLGEDDATAATYCERYRVVFDNTDDPRVRKLIAMSAAAIDPHTGLQVPKGFSQHIYSPWLIVRGRHIRPLGPMDFEIDIEYSNRADYCTNEAAAAQFINPIDEPWDIEYIQWEFTDRLDYDMDGKAIVNANREPPDPNLQEEFGRLGVRITRAQEFWDNRFMDDYAKAVNSDAFWGYAPDECFMNRIGARRMRMGDFFFWQATFEILFNPFRTVNGITIGGFQRRIRHEGFRIKKWEGAAGSSAIIIAEATDDEGTRVSQPVLLDAEGWELEEGQPATWLDFRTKRRVSFAELALE